ncbi:MAG: hypothetical protein QOJ46_1485 [bacterium]|jgi:hypothetical protein
MAHSEARAWWADVQHLRDGYERTDEARRRADEADLAARRATRERRGVEAEVNSMLSAPRRTSGGPAITPRRAPEPALAPRRGQHAGRDLAPQHAVENAPDRFDADVATGVPPRRARIKGAATPGRRTIEIRGQVVPAPDVTHSLEIDRRRPSRRGFERVGGRPDRVAMWALLMGLMLILVAIGTAGSPAVVALTLY